MIKIDEMREETLNSLLSRLGEIRERCDVTIRRRFALIEREVMNMRLENALQHIDGLKHLNRAFEGFEVELLELEEIDK